VGLHREVGPAVSDGALDDTCLTCHACSFNVAAAPNPVAPRPPLFQTPLTIVVGCCLNSWRPLCTCPVCLVVPCAVHTQLPPTPSTCYPPDCARHDSNGVQGGAAVACAANREGVPGAAAGGQQWQGSNGGAAMAEQRSWQSSGTGARREAGFDETPAILHRLWRDGTEESTEASQGWACTVGRRWDVFPHSAALTIMCTPVHPSAAHSPSSAHALALLVAERATWAGSNTAAARRGR